MAAAISRRGAQDSSGDRVTTHRTPAERLGPPLALFAICLLALAVRLHRLAEPLMRWDEAWSVAHASRSLLEVVRIASWEVHPPLFYLVLKPWLSIGRHLFLVFYLVLNPWLSIRRHLFLVRVFPVFIGVLTVPISYRLALRWLGRRPVAILAAGLTALAPGLVYYSQVLRMYPFVVLWLLLATWALMHWLERGRTWVLVALWVAGTAALYTLYYSAFALLGLFFYGVLVGRRRRAGLAIAGVLTSIAFLPWLAYAGGGLVERMAQAAPAETIMPVTPWGLAVSVWTALTFDFGTGGWAALAVLAILLGAVAVNWPNSGTRRRLLMPLVALVTTVAGITLGSGFYFFAARLLTPAVPYLILFLAWALGALQRRSRVLFVFAGIVLVVCYWPTSTRFVYEKRLEVSGEFDPHEYHSVLSTQAAPEDLVFFNELALAGWYEMDRGPQDPPWSYALRWTPIIEPMSTIAPRVEQAMGERPRLWFVLYKGSFGPGREFKDWLDGTLYSASTTWGKESLFLSYLPPAVGTYRISPAADFGGLIQLEAAEFGERIGPEGQVPITLRWRALDGPLPDLRVVVQAWDETGSVLAQRDVRPANWERPAYDWAVGDVVEDRHGLLLARESATPVHLAVSVYDAATGETLPVGGEPFLELGTVGGRP